MKGRQLQELMSVYMEPLRYHTKSLETMFKDFADQISIVNIRREHEIENDSYIFIKIENGIFEFIKDSTIYSENIEYLNLNTI